MPNIYNIILYDLLFSFLDVLFHKGIIRIAGFINRQDDFFFVYSYIIDFTVKAIFFFQPLYNSCYKQIAVFI